MLIASGAEEMEVRTELSQMSIKFTVGTMNSMPYPPSQAKRAATKNFEKTHGRGSSTLTWRRGICSRGAI